MKYIMSITLFAIALTAAYACNYSIAKPPPPYNPNRIVFMDVAQRVFIAEPQCISCHHSGMTYNGKPMLDLMIYHDVMSDVIAGNPKQSKLYKQIASGNMPPDDSKLPAATDEETQIVYDWILQGSIEK